ncbi:MAG: ribosome silencing factor [Candidatus Hydrogenedentes bacterium]|nr:ribosome silencing factor [Candidatus Hydrogenedentota bacterium]
MARLVKKTATTSQPEFLLNARRIALLADEHKAERIIGYDVGELTLLADAFVICTATSEPHVKAVYSAVKEGMREAGSKTLHAEGTYTDGWVVLDYGDVIFHVFRKEAREFYDLDGLWGDAPRIDLALPKS